jgi:hypothetical protein
MGHLPLWLALVDSLSCGKTCPVDLVLGPSDRRLTAVEELLDQFIEDPAETGNDYLDYAPTSSPDRLVPEDLAVTLPMNSFASALTFRSIVSNGHKIADRLAALPHTALEESDAQVRGDLVDLIAAVACWPYIKVSVATKLLHKKRPALIPVLDNRAIFGALLWSEWSPPTRVSRGDSIDGRSVGVISEAVQALYRDLTRRENAATWDGLTERTRVRHGKERSRIELLDMVWWRYFRNLEPPPGRRPAS